MKHKCPHCKYEWETDKRSIPANNFFHLIVGRVAEFTGDSFEKTKDQLKEEGGFYTEIPSLSRPGRLVVKLEDTRKMDKWRMSELVDFAFMYANSIGVNIQTPEEYKEWLLKIQKQQHERENTHSQTDGQGSDPKADV